MGNMGTSGRLIPQPDCRVKNKTLGIAGLGNVKKPDEKWKSIQAQNRDQFRTKWTQGADRAPGTIGKQTNACMGTLFQPCRCCWAQLHEPPCPPQVSGSPTQAEVVGGLGGAVIPLGSAAVSFHQLCSLSLTSSTVCCPPLDTASTRRFSSCFPVISTGLQASSSSPVPSW